MRHNLREILTGLLAILILLAACTKRPAPAEPEEQAPLASAVTITIATAGGIPTEPGSGMHGMQAAELTVHRDGQQLYFDDAGSETDDADVAFPVTVYSGTDFTAQLSLEHGSYSILATALDGKSEAIADGVATVNVDEPIAITLAMISLTGFAELSGPETMAQDEPIEAALSVRPYEGSELIVPTTDFDVEWTITGGANDHETGKSGARVSATDECRDIHLTAGITRTGQTETSSAAQLELDASLYCAEAGLGLEDTEPPVLTLNGMPGSMAFGRTVRLSGTAADTGSGMHTVEIFDGPTPAA